MTTGQPPASRLPPPSIEADVLDRFGSLPPEQLELIQQVLREREHLFLLHDALIDVERAGTLNERLQIFADAIRKVGFGRVVISLRNADFDPVLFVTAGLTPDEERGLRSVPTSGNTWRRRMPELERFRVSQSYYLEGNDPWVKAEFRGGIPSSLQASPDDGDWSPSDLLVVPLRRPDQTIVAMLVLDDPVDRRRPSLARIQAVELFGQQMTWVIEQTRNDEMAKRRAERLQLLHDVGGALARSLDEREIIHELARQVTRILPAEGIVIVRPDLEARTLQTLLRVVRGKERPRAPQPLGRGPLAEVAATGRAVRIADWDPATAPLASADDVVGDGGPAGSLLAVPMMVGIQLIAIVAVYTAARGAYGVEEEEILHTIGAQAATSLINARLYGDSLRERRQGEALAEVARAVNESLRLAEVLDLTVRHAMAITHASGATVSLRTPGQNELEIVAAVGAAAMLLGIRLPMDQSISGRVARELLPVIQNDVGQDPDSFAPTRNQADIRKLVAVPLVTGTEAIGVLSVANRDEDFEDADARVLQRIADHVAVAIVNARLFEQVARYQRVVETAGDAIVITGTDHRIAFVNPAARTLLAYDGELVGVDVDHFVPVEHQERVRFREEQALSGTPQRYDAEMVRGNGERRTVSVSTAPLEEGGRITGVVASLRDVTEERRARSAVLEYEAQYVRLVESATDGIFTLDEEGMFTSVNAALEKAVGQPRAMLLGHSFLELVDERDREATTALFRMTISGHRQRGEMRFRSPDGAERCGSITTTPIIEGGEAVGALVIIRDVTDEKRLTDQLLQQEKLAAIGQLVSGVAHELNNPLAGVMAFSQLLHSEAEKDSEQANALEIIQQEARRAAKIVANLLTFARQHQPERTLTDLNQVVLDTLELRRYTLRMHQIELDVHLDQNLPLTWADPFQMQQVVLNLVTNAEYALIEHDGARRLGVRTACRGGEQITIEISDSGKGIARADLDRVFNPFFTTKPVGRGTGLGLSISDGIIREHGGRIHARSVPGSGATFTIELPLAHPPGITVSDEEKPVRSRAVGRRVLLVDDERSIRSALSTYLTSGGHTVTAVGTGAAALEQLAGGTFDVLLLDLRLPDIPGDELFARIGSRFPDHAARIIFLTGDITSERSRAFLESSGRPHLGKPFQLEEVSDLIREIPATRTGPP